MMSVRLAEPKKKGWTPMQSNGPQIIPINVWGKIGQIWVIWVTEVGVRMDKMAGWADVSDPSEKSLHWDMEVRSMFGQGPLPEQNFFWWVVGVVGQHEIANTCSTEVTVLVGSRFGQIEPTGWEARGHFGQKCQNSKILSRQKWGVSGNFGIKHLWELSGIKLSRSLPFTVKP